MAVDTIARGMAASAQGGSSDYSDLSNKPSINGVTLSGNKTSSDLGISDMVFVATYGVTSRTDVQTALNAGKVVLVNGGSTGQPQYIYQKQDASSNYLFVGFMDVNKTKTISLRNNGSWAQDRTDQLITTPELPKVTTPTWGSYKQDGSVTPSLTLPSISTNMVTTQTFIYAFTAATTGATFTAPNNAMLIDTDGATTYTVGNSLVLSELTVGNLYECNFSVYSTGSTHYYIVLVMKGYPVA